jgi:hypothetical protein
MYEQRVVVRRYGPNYRVVRLVNLVEPEIESIISAPDVKDFVARANEYQGFSVEILPEEGRD